MQARVKEDQTFKPFTIELTVETKREVEFLYHLLLGSSLATASFLNHNVPYDNNSRLFEVSEISSLISTELLTVLRNKL